MITQVGYHWSPTYNRGEIRKHGLVVGSPSLTNIELGFICFSLDPHWAWALSGDTDWGEEEEDWDLWQVHFQASDDLRVRLRGNEVIEVRSHATISPDRLWWVGTRQPWLTA